MKKIILMAVLAIATCSLFGQPMLKRSKTFILNSIKKDRSLHNVGATTQEDMEYNKTLVNHPYVNEVWYSKTIKPKGLYAFEAKYVHNFNENDICYEYTITI